MVLNIRFTPLKVSRHTLEFVQKGVQTLRPVVMLQLKHLTSLSYVAAGVVRVRLSDDTIDWL